MPLTNLTAAPRWTALAACLWALVLSAAPDAFAAAATPTTVYLVRHAEQVRDTTSNPPLSEAGALRARALRDELKSARLSAVFATHYRRSQGTALPVAQSHQLEVSTYEPKDYAGLARRIRTIYAGKSVLVVAHSNTVPGIIAALGGPKLDDLGHDEFDDFFIVAVYADTAKVARLSYGEKPEPADSQ